MVSLSFFQQGVVRTARGIQGLKGGEILHNQSHIRLVQVGDGQLPGVIGIAAAPEGDVPRDPAARQLGLEGIVMGRGDILLPQIQLQRIDGVCHALNKNMIFHIPQVAKDTGHCDEQNQHNDYQNGNCLLFHRFDLLNPICQKFSSLYHDLTFPSIRRGKENRSPEDGSVLRAGWQDHLSWVIRTAQTTRRPLSWEYSQVDRHSSLSP